jgi:hypothetical protein
MQSYILPPSPPNCAWVDGATVPPLPEVPPLAKTRLPKEVFPPFVPGLPFKLFPVTEAPPVPLAPTVIVTEEGI